MLPDSGWLAEPIDTVPIDRSLPGLGVELSFIGGAIDFDSVERNPPFLADVLSSGDFESELITGRNVIGDFGFLVAMRRFGVYGTLLVDTLYFNVATYDTIIEICEPNTVVLSEDTCDSVGVMEVSSETS